MTSIAITTWPTLRSTTGTRHTGAWSDLAAWLAMPRAADTADGWSPIVSRGDRRKADAVEQIHAVVLDVDTGDVPLERLRAALEGVRAVVHTTRSSTPAHPRWRVVVAVERPMTPAEHAATWTALRDRMHAHGIAIDEVTRDPARLWFAPRAPAEGEYVALEIEGEPHPVTIPPSASPYARAALRGEVERVQSARNGERNAALNRAAYSLGQIVAAGDLAEHEVRAELADAARAVGLDADETRATIASGLRAGTAHPRDPAPAPAAEPDPRPRALAPADVIAAWHAEGPLEHEPTGIAPLDELTGGGPVYGSRWYLLGAPDAGKTALAIQIADTWARRGIAVGILAVDEEPTDIVTRLAQRAGITRAACERRDEIDLARAAMDLADLPIRLYDGGWSIERAAADLRAWAGDRRAALVIDSVQTAHCDAEEGADSLRLAVSARTRAIRDVATSHRLIVISTSEMSRGAYAGPERTAALAAAKESGAIEYSARVMLALRSVPGESDLLELEVAKNKHGPSGAKLHLAIDRRHMRLATAAAPPPPTEVRSAFRRARDDSDAAAVALAIASQPGIGVRGLRMDLRARMGSISSDRVDVALARLGRAVVRREGARGAVRLHLHGGDIADTILALLPPEERAKVGTSRVPDAEVDHV